MVSHHVPLPLIISLSIPHIGFPLITIISFPLVIPLSDITTFFPLIGSIIGYSGVIPLFFPLVIGFISI